MRIQISRESEQLGAVTIHGVYNVIELDSGPSDHESSEPAIARIPLNKIRKIQNEMAIVVPIKDEKFKLFENVLSGIPNNVQIIVVSNSTTQPLNRFAAEKKILDRYSKFTFRTSIIVHQKDERIANALREAGYEELLGEDGKIRNGKGEGMVLGIILAKALGKKYVGFVDADNYFPGSVWEYVTVYAAGLSLLDSPFSMVRIVWKYKPKVIKGLYFKRRGRVSVITNRYLNFLISMKLGFETEIIKTGNSGEHVMTMDLAERIRTSVKIIHVANVSRTDVKFWVKNIGSSSFSTQQILMSDVFFGRVGNFQRYDYSDSGVGWNYTILGGDEDEYWECGETMEVTIHLSETLTAGDYYVTFITHNGIKSEKAFSIG